MSMKIIVTLKGVPKGRGSSKPRSDKETLNSDWKGSERRAESRLPKTPAKVPDSISEKDPDVKEEKKGGEASPGDRKSKKSSRNQRGSNRSGNRG